MTREPTVKFCFDYASPWTYIADCRVERVMDGLPIEIQYMPVYLRGFEMFRSGMPYTTAKLAYIARDMQRCASFHGIPLHPPSHFPINGLHLLRATVALEGRPELNLVGGDDHNERVT